MSIVGTVTFKCVGEVFWFNLELSGPEANLP